MNCQDFNIEKKRALSVGDEKLNLNTLINSSEQEKQLLRFGDLMLLL